MNTFFATIPGRLFASLLVVVTLGGGVRASDVVDNWSFLEPGVLPKVSNFAASGIPIYIAGLKAGGVVDAKSTPANPFSGATRALFVEPAPDKGVLRIFTRPFPDKTPAKGFYEFTFRLVDGGFSFNPEFFSAPSDPTGNWFKGTEQFFGFAFIPKSPIIISPAKQGLVTNPPKQSLVTEEVKTISTEENYTFRVEWQTSGDHLEFHFLLNGKPLTAASGEAVSMSVPQSKVAETVLGFRLASGSTEQACFKGFLGSIQAEAIAP
jgi:hypothetical protein